MARLTQGILGGVSGRVGNVVGYSCRGKAYIRALPASVKNPRTPQQLRIRGLMRMVTQTLRPLTPLLRAGFVGTSGMSAANAAMSVNIRHFYRTQTPDAPDGWVLSPSELIVSSGVVTHPISISPGRDAQFSLAWEEPAEGSDLEGAKVYVAVMSGSTGRVASFAMDADAGSMVVHAYSVADGSDDEVLFVWALLANSRCSSTASYLEA